MSDQGQRPDDDPYAAGPGPHEGPGQHGGSYGPMPSGSERTSPAVAMPKEVNLATLLLLASAALGIISTLVGLTMRDEILAQVEEQAGVGTEMAETAAGIGLAVGVVFGLVIAAIYVALALLMRNGKNWARIVTWVLLGLAIAFGLFGLPSAINGLALTLGIIALLLNITVVVLLALRPSNEFFAAHSARRR